MPDRGSMRSSPGPRCRRSPSSSTLSPRPGTGRSLEARVAIASFDARTLAQVSAASEVVARLLILKHVPDDVVLAAAEAGVRGILVDRKAALARPEMIDDVHAAGVRIVVYTLNRDSQWDAV